VRRVVEFAALYLLGDVALMLIEVRLELGVQLSTILHIPVACMVAI
jgi:hypothetical protein